MSDRGSEIMDVGPQCGGGGTCIEALSAQAVVCSDPDQLEDGRICASVDHEVLRSRAATNHARTVDTDTSSASAMIW
jgi:hypothetical protein